ncbi:hypothetical protein ACFFHH_22430 [Cytobacillus solani]|uniref:hypothetical protein n=1 Tax=Cytobacillus solani TaxID=1637975 RepID=UPI0006ABA57B|nr:hypothetical protein [Cytobacillus solani]KOP82300.1 hypothetical protein AMS60_07240 [Bacillus sp. FJAT-21945]
MIVFHVAANEKIGMGNLSRCFSIGKHLGTTINNIVIICEGKQKLATVFAFEEGKIYYVEDREKALEWIQVLFQKKAKNNNILITDIIELNEHDRVSYEMVGAEVIIQLNDVNVDRFCPDIFINGDNFVEVKNKQIKKYTGSTYQIIRNDLIIYRPQHFIKIKNIKKVMIVLGGSDPSGYTEKFINFFNNNYLAYTFYVVCGPGFNNNRRKRLMNNYLNRNIIILDNPYLPEYLVNVDVVVTLGGLTSYEAMYLGKPVLAIEWAHMSYYVKELEKKGLLKSLGNGEEVFGNLVSNLNNIPLLNDIAKSGWYEIDGKGTERIVNLIKGILMN